MDSQGTAASSAPPDGTNQREAARSAVAAEIKDPGASQVATEAAQSGDGPGHSGDDNPVMTAPGHRPVTHQESVETRPQPHTRVGGRLLEAALLNLRNRVAAIPLVFEIDGAPQAKTVSRKLLSHI